MSMICSRSLSALVVLSTWLCGCRSDIQVTVKNATAQTLSEVLIIAEPFHLPLGSLAPHQEGSGHFRPRRDTSLSLEFSTPTGDRRVERVNSYFSRGACGEVVLVVGADLIPQMAVDNSGLPPCWREPLRSWLSSEIAAQGH